MWPHRGVGQGGGSTNLSSTLAFVALLRRVRPGSDAQVQVNFPDAGVKWLTLD